MWFRKTKSFQMLKLLNESKKIFGFDSFCGFPNPTKEDRSPRNPKKGDWNILSYEGTIISKIS